ncbi:MAG: cyclic nucleotide-binding domain-containing protein [Oscillospiraceae bacterium]|nr:cyclic nucleotide-binding domain-containing protein [Oscillospiraceae bacterium]
METVTTSKGQILFREGDLALTMYVIKAGSVGVYTDYGTSGEKQIAVLKQDDFLGEMGMIEGLPRNATAVILEDATVLTELNEEDLALFFRNRPDQIIRIMRQLSSRIREIDGRFYSACHALRESEAAAQSGTGKSDDLNRKLLEISREADRQDSIRIGQYSSFFPYVLEDLEQYGKKANIVKAGFLEKRFKRTAAPEELHANPDDEFSKAAVGPNDRIIMEYVKMIPQLRRFDEPIYPEPVYVSKLESGGYRILNGHHRWAAALKCGLEKLRIRILNPGDSGGLL